jgi:hypothetical protein
MNSQANDHTGRQVHATVRRNVARRDGRESDPALEDPRPRAVSTAWHWRHGLDTVATTGARS